jgi:hypothetical protein
MSFSIKSSHKFVNPTVQEPEKTKHPSYFDSKYPNLTSQVSLKKPRTSTDTKVKAGSEGGMAIRTNVLAMAYYY